MKILVLSDSHGNVDNMARAVEKEQPRLILHLGDCWGDAERLRKRFPNIPMEQVPGNCDYRSMEPAERLLFIEDKRVMICHGHTLGVKQSLLRAGLKAEEENLDLLLFGHTHYSMVDYDGKLYMMNPGSIGDYHAPTYGVITIEGSRADCSVYRL